MDGRSPQQDRRLSIPGDDDAEGPAGHAPGLKSRRWVVDGNNVMGSRPDRWWNDRPAAMERLTQEIAEWCWTHDDDVLVVFDGREVEKVSSLGGGNLTVRFSGSPVRDSADDTIVTVADDLRGDHLVVVTADKGLRRRLPPTADVEGPRSFLTRLASELPRPD